MSDKQTVVTSKKQLEDMKKPQLVELAFTIKKEDEEALDGINAKSTKAVLVKAIADYYGFDEIEKAEEKPQPTAKVQEQLDTVLAELGLGGEDEIEVELPQTEEKTGEEQPTNKVSGKGGAKKTKTSVNKKKEQKPKVPMDAPIPITTFRGLTIGIYGNILEEREEPDENGFKYEEIKLERFNAKAHEKFRNTNGRTLLAYTQAGSTYMIIVEDADGTRHPVLEVTNKGRGHLRCKQLANFLHLAHTEKVDREIIDQDTYNELAGKIEKMEVAVGL